MEQRKNWVLVWQQWTPHSIAVERSSQAKFSVHLITGIRQNFFNLRLTHASASPSCMHQRHAHILSSNVRDVPPNYPHFRISMCQPFQDLQAGTKNPHPSRLRINMVPWSS